MTFKFQSVMEKVICENLKYLCYVCGKYTPTTPKYKQRQIEQSPGVVCKYNAIYQDLQMVVLTNVDYAPTFFCKKCYSALNEEKSYRALPEIPMIWSKPLFDHSNCYACLLPDLFNLSMRADLRKTLKYPNYPESSSKRPVYSSVQEISPNPVPLAVTVSKESQVTQSSHEEYKQPVGRTKRTSNKQTPLSQSEFNDHCRDLNLGVKASELEGSRLKERGALLKEVKTTLYRREKKIWSSKFKNEKLVLCIKNPKLVPDIEREEYDSQVETAEEISMTYTVTFLKDIDGLFQLLHSSHVPADWRLFLDGSTNSFKAVLIHNQNERPSIPLAYIKRIPEKYEAMVQILKFIDYEKYKWEIIVDFKLINILYGLMGAASKNPCIFCLWDARYEGPDKYTKRDWPSRPSWSTSTEGKHNATKPPLVSSDKILMPVLHIKIGLVTQLFKNIYKNNEKARLELPKIVKGLSDAKHKAGVYNGPQIRTLFAHQKQLSNVLTDKEYHAFFCLMEVCNKFLGNKKDSDSEILIQNMMNAYEILNISITIKMHTLICHLQLFRENCGRFSDQQGERFHQDIKGIEKDYGGKDMSQGLGRYCWSLIRQTDPNCHKRKKDYATKVKYFNIINQN